MPSRHSVETYQGNELTRKSAGNACLQSSQLAQPLWTDPGLKSGPSASELIVKKTKKKQPQGRLFRRRLPHNPRIRGEAILTEGLLIRCTKKTFPSMYLERWVLVQGRCAAYINDDGGKSFSETNKPRKRVCFDRVNVGFAQLIGFMSALIRGTDIPHS